MCESGGEGKCLLLTVLRVAPGAEKTGAGKHVVLVGRLLCAFVIGITIRGPDRRTESGEGGIKGMLFHTVHKGRGKTERDVGAGSVCPASSFLVLPLLPS